MLAQSNGLDRNLAKKDLDAHQGQWKVVWVERNGVKTQVEATVVHTIRGNKWFIGELECCVIELDPTCDPKVIDYVNLLPEGKGVRVEGIYRIDGDSLVWCWEGTDGVPSRPVEFRTERGTSRMMYGFVRVPPNP
jgi:uncharacterized protein (TIGR03067 family)